MGKHIHKITEHEGTSGVCRNCGPVDVRLKRNRAGNYQPVCGPGDRAVWKETHRSPYHGLTYAERQAFIEEHGSCCEICGGTETLRVDHDHDTEELRGLLCQDCNLGLGKFKDDEKLLEIALAYLRKSS